MVRRTTGMNCLKVETMRREIIRTKRGYIKLYKYIYIVSWDLDWRLLNSIFQISLTSLTSFIEGSESTVAVRNVNQLIPIAKTTTTHAKVHKDFLRLLVVTAIISATYSVHCTPYRITCLRKIVTNSDQNNEKKEFNYLYSIFAVFHLYFGLYTNRMCISNTWTLLFIILSIQLNNNRKQPKN